MDGRQEGAANRVAWGRSTARRAPEPPLVDRAGGVRSRLSQVAEGLSNWAIAARLVVAERTIETHMSSIFGKLDLGESPDRHRRVLAVLTLLRS